MDAKKIIDKAAPIIKKTQDGTKAVQQIANKVPRPANVEKIANISKPIQKVSEVINKEGEKTIKKVAAIASCSTNVQKNIPENSPNWILKGFGTIGAIFVAVQLAKSAYNYMYVNLVNFLTKKSNAAPSIRFYRFSATGPALQRKFKEAFPIPQSINELPPGPEVVSSTECLICTTKSPEIIYLNCRHKVCCLEDTIGWFYIKFLRIIESGLYDQCTLDTEFIITHLFAPSPTAVSCPVCRTPIEKLFL